MFTKLSSNIMKDKSSSHKGACFIFQNCFWWSCQTNNMATIPMQKYFLLANSNTSKCHQISSNLNGTLSW